MNREAYKLANSIKTELGVSEDYLKERPDDIMMKRVKDSVLQEIKREKQTKKRKFRGGLAAACAVVIMLSGTVVFGDDVHAMLKQMSWSIVDALGIPSDLADYKEIVNTSVADNGYVITLQEAVASEEKLVINYTIEREDGASMDEILTADGSLYINGKHVTGGAGGGAGFLDEEQKTVGIVMEYHVPDVDFSKENNFRLVFDNIGIMNNVSGKWVFEFTVDGTDLIIDTKRTVIEKEFELPDGVIVTLNLFTTNELEQRIHYTFSAPTDYILKIEAVDSAGKQVEFSTRVQGMGTSYMQNDEIFDDGRLDENAESATMTLYAVELPEESGMVNEEYEQIGESFEVVFD